MMTRYFKKFIIPLSALAVILACGPFAAATPQLSSYNLPAVMDGDFEMFIDELATRDEAERLGAAGMAD